jgi:Uma2 family endonuclease
MSVATSTQTLLTPEEFLARPDRDRYELVDGELVELSMSQLSSLVAWELGRLLGNFCTSTGIAWVFGADNGYRCFPGRPNLVRKPDVSVVLRERLPADRLSEGWSPLPPDVAVEVISPADLAYEVDEKVDEYQSAGVRLVWIVNPERRTVRVHRLDGTVSLLRAEDMLTGEDILPGFACQVAALFPAVEPPRTPTPETEPAG